MPAVSLPPKENALFKRILVSVRRRAGAGDGFAGSRACQPRARAGGRAGAGPPRGDPTSAVLPGGAHSLPSPRPGNVPTSVRAPRPAGLRRPRFRTRPGLPGIRAARLPFTLLERREEQPGLELGFGPHGPGVARPRARDRDPAG